ncbi:MAG: hypothetical protein AVDCRST_MAG89-4073, partial [uncultured Gemmatimonadetes bacterium]
EEGDLCGAGDRGGGARRGPGGAGAEHDSALHRGATRPGRARGRRGRRAGPGGRVRDHGGVPAHSALRDLRRVEQLRLRRGRRRHHRPGLRLQVGRLRAGRARDAGHRRRHLQPVLPARRPLPGRRDRAGGGPGRLLPGRAEPLADPDGALPHHQRPRLRDPRRGAQPPLL